MTEEKREQLLDELMQFSEKNDIDLPKGWNQRGIPKLKELLNELKGIKPDDEQPKANLENGEQLKSKTNPFGEEVISVVIPIDKQNPKIKTFWASVNGKSLLFPVGKIAKMPRSYYELYLKSMQSDLRVQAKMEEYRMKEI